MFRYLASSSQPFPAASPDLKPPLNPTGGAINSLCWTTRWWLRDESRPCRVCLSSLRTPACWTALSLVMTPAYLQRARLEDEEGADETRARYEPPRRTSWATLWEGERRQWRAGGACHLVRGFDVPTKGSRAEERPLTLFVFWMPGGKRQQQEVQRDLC